MSKLLILMMLLVPYFVNAKVKEPELDYLIRRCDILCIGSIIKCDISRGTSSFQYFQIQIYKMIYNNISVPIFDTISIISQHDQGALCLNQLYTEYLILLHYDPSLKEFITVFAFPIEVHQGKIDYKDDIKKLECSFCLSNVCGFIVDDKFKYLHKGLLPDQIKRIPLKWLDVYGKKQLFIPLKFFLEYFYKIKNIKP